MASGLVGVKLALAGGFVQHGYRLGVSFLGGTLVAGRNSRVHLFQVCAHHGAHRCVVLTALFRMIDAGDVPRLVLPNPDLVYPSDDGFGMASGSVALIIEAALRQRYPERGGLEFERLGKPNGAIFEEAFRRTGTMDMVMLGDGLETDIRGANSFGIDSALVAGGVTPADGLSVAVDVPTYWVRGLAG